MLTNQRDAFRSQSRSPNVVPFHMLGIVRYSMLCRSKFVFKTRRFSDIRLQKSRDLEKWVRGPSRSLEMSPSDRAPRLPTDVVYNYGSTDQYSEVYNPKI